MSIRITLGLALMAIVILTIRFGLVVPGVLLVLVVLTICGVAAVVSWIDRAERAEIERDGY